MSKLNIIYVTNIKLKVNLTLKDAKFDTKETDRKKYILVLLLKPSFLAFGSWVKRGIAFFH